MVVRDDTVTANGDVLLIIILPLLESAAIAWEARLRAVVLPMPLVALRSTVLAVIRLPPWISPPPAATVAVSVTVPLFVVIGFERTMSWPEVSDTLPVAVIAFGTLMPHTLATLMSPAAEEIAEKPCDTLALAARPVWATSEPVEPVISPEPVMLPAEVR